MAQTQLTLNPFSGSEKENFREFELLLRSILAVAALPANQQANFLQLHLRDAALRFFQTSPLATRQNLELSITALRDRFCNPQLQELHVLKLENMKFDSKIDTPEKILVTLQTKATKAYPDPDPPAVAPIDPHAADAVVARTRFDQETARRAEIIRSAQEARSVQIRRQFIKNMPGWLRAKLLEQPENTSVEDLCVFARKQLSIHNLCKTDDSVMDAFSEMGPSVTDTLVTALTKLSTSQEAMDNRLNEMSKKFEERNTTLTNQFNDFQKNQTQQPQRGSFSQNRGQTSNSSRGNDRGNFRGRFRGNARGFRGPRPNYQRPQWQNQNQNSYTPRQQSYQNFPQQNSNSFFQPQSSIFQHQNSNFPNQNFENQNSQPQNSIFQPQLSSEVFTPDPNYMPYTQQTQITCHKCGYPNHLATNCTVRKNPPRRGAQNPFNQNSKN